jgi:hypothetical protein
MSRMEAMGGFEGLAVDSKARRVKVRLPAH